MTKAERKAELKQKYAIALALTVLTVGAIVGGTSDYNTAKAEKEIITEIEVSTTETEETDKMEVKVSNIKHTKEKVEPIKFYDIPLSYELQLHIFQECEKHNICPAVIIAMIERESNFQSDAIGDNGKSFGLMQIQKRYHEDRMARLGVTDLLNPFENVTVGIDLVAELKNENPELYWVLMAYNGGRSYANKAIANNWISEYALEVSERSSELQREMED